MRRKYAKEKRVDVTKKKKERRVALEKIEGNVLW